MEYSEILHRCFRCGYCKLPSGYQDLNCPPYLKRRFESFAPGGRMWLLRAWLEQEIPASKRLAEIMYSCAGCANCVENCVFPKFKSDLLNAFTAGREELVNTGQVPGMVQNYFKAITMYGNPYKMPEAERGDWARDLGIETYNGHEYLFYVGCPGSFDEIGIKMARAVATVLKERGISFGIMGENETCDGNEVRTMGEKGLFQALADKNIESFKKAGVEKIITLSPHAYHAFKNYYPLLGGSFQVMHYAQLLAGHAAGPPKGEARPLRVTFHDPCYLGRHNMDYLTPRAVLQAIPGVELVEMDRTMADSLCCGGGDGNFFTDVLGSGPDSPARRRVREARETGANVLAVACPKCARMLDDAVRDEELASELEVMDLAEIILAQG
ncbi:MAG: (Fe-S)-binding protein [bacterium]